MSFIEWIYWITAFLFGCFCAYKQSTIYPGEKWKIGICFIVGFILFPITLGVYVLKEET